MTVVFAMQSYSACSPSNVVDYANKLKSMTDQFRTVHQHLYLGGGNLNPFSDPRLVNYWCVGCTAGWLHLLACSTAIPITFQSAVHGILTCHRTAA